MTMLAGHKTYILSGLGALLTAAYMLGLLGRETWEALMGMLMAGGLGTLRAAVAKGPA